MRGTVHIVGRPQDIEATFESNPLANPPKDVYYRRAVYQIALERLRVIQDAIKAHDTQHTGKVYRDEHGNAVGRGKGIMPSLGRQFPEVRDWTKGPALLARTIREAKTPLYFELLQDAVNQVEAQDGEQLELFVKSADKQTLAELPPVMYPAHQGNKSCTHCRAPHPAALHRFHLRGSFDRSHIGQEEAAHRKRERERDQKRFKEDIPF